jgi:hypothetical protein
MSKTITRIQAVAFNAFSRRQTANSPFSHWTISDAELLQRVNDALQQRQQKAGYRDGVILVPINPNGFFSSVIRLQNGDKLHGEYKSRREGEMPRIGMYATGNKMPAQSVDVVLYSHEVLGADASTEATWEIVSVNASPEEGEAPIQPNTLMHNHFGSDGGTATNMTNDEFVAALKVSFEYWKDKALCG